MSRYDQFPSDLPAKVQLRLGRLLPGRSAQRRFTPELSYGRQYGPPSHDTRDAAVVVLLCPLDGIWCLLLTVRSIHVVDHAGQISLPGGAVESGETSQDAALRELHEELGITPSSVQPLGRLSTIHLFVSNFLVTPWVAFAPRLPVIRPNSFEVAEVLEVPLSVLVDPNNHGRAVIQHRGFSFTAPHIIWQGHRIWGGTAMILGELIAVLGQLSG